MKYPASSSSSSASSFSSPPRAVRWGWFIVLVLAVVISWWPSSSSTMPQLGSMLGGVAVGLSWNSGILDKIVTGIFVTFWTWKLWVNSEYGVSNVTAAVSYLLSDDGAWTWLVFGLLVMMISITHRVAPWSRTSRMYAQLSMGSCQPTFLQSAGFWFQWIAALYFLVYYPAGRVFVAPCLVYLCYVYWEQGIPSFSALPQDVRFHIYNYLSDDDKLNCAMTCKLGNRDLQVSHGLERAINPICFFFVDKNNSDDAERGIRLLQKLGRKKQEHDARKQQPLQNYQRIKITNVHQFGTVGVHQSDLGVRSMLFCLNFLAHQARMTGVTDLDVSVAIQQTVTVYRDFIMALPHMLPNVRVLNLTNIVMGDKFINLRTLTKFCPKLEKIIWNNARIDHPIDGNYVVADGDNLVDCQNLNEIEMNNCRFLFLDFDARSNDPNKFLFHKCSEKLERVFIKNATTRSVTGTDTPIPQAELVKFVRNVPSLRYFSSDLTPDNITMLQSDRPDIVFE